MLIDVQAYFDAAREAMSKARRSIHFLNWAFEPETSLNPQPGGATRQEDQICRFLIDLAKTRPELDIRVLCWESALPVAATQKFFPILDRGAFAGSPVKFVLDGRVPIGACHHQKAIVIDDSIAFCGGCDIGQDRWDTPRHLDNDSRREKTKGSPGHFINRHEVMAVVDGDPAAALGELFRLRWRRCTGETLAPPSTGGSAPWPTRAPPAFEDVRVGLSRTEPAWRGQPEVRECEALHLAAISAAKRCIYMENQYFTSELLGDALASRLAEPNGPEVVLISGGRSPSYFDRLTMDPTRSRFIERLQAADHSQRFQIYSPVTSLGGGIIVHAKLTIIDDVLIRVGSANLDNRSYGFDTECDLSLEAEGPTAPSSRVMIGRLRSDLLAHWLGCATEVVDGAVAREQSVCRGLESLRDAGYCRLRPIAPQHLHPVASLIASLHIGDPMTPWDSFRPWRRRRALALRRQSPGMGT